MKVKRYLSLFLILTIMLSVTKVAYAAPTYKDVPTYHWAYGAISRMADKGYMVAGDSSGNYYPDQVLDKFYTSSVLAKAAGYKYVGLTESEKLYQDRAYDANRAALANLKANYPVQWDSSVDREISYLIENRVLTISDLNMFIKKTGVTEQRYALTREELALYLVKLIEKQNEVSSEGYNALFTDDNLISTQYKPYVYYLKSLGIVNGGTDGNFNPRGVVTKATLCVLLDKCVEIMPAQSTNASAASSYGNEILSVSGRISNVFIGLNAVQVDDESGTSNIYTIKPSTGITVDGFVSSIDDLLVGMEITSIVNQTAREFIDIKATSQTTSAIPADTVLPESYRTVQGIVKATVKNSGAFLMDVDVKYLSPRNDVYEYTEVYEVTSNCEIYRGTKKINFDDIEKGEIIELKISGVKAYEIHLEEKNLSTTGELIEKSEDEKTGVVTFTIKYGKVKNANFRIDSDTEIKRKGVRTPKWFDLRIGDKVEIEAEYDLITYIYATGDESVVKGTVKEIFISESINKITIKNSKNSDLESYRIIDNTYDLSSVPIGSTVKLTLDSKEVIDIDVVDIPESSTSMTGKITEGYKSSRDYIYVEDSYSKVERQVFINSDTEIIDSLTGKTVPKSYLAKSIKIYVAFGQKVGGKSFAKSITILE